MLSGRGLCDELITRSEESYRLCCAVVCDLETSRIGAPYIYDISSLRINVFMSLKCLLDVKYMCKDYISTKGLWALLEHLVIQGVPGESAML